MALCFCSLSLVAQSSVRSVRAIVRDARNKHLIENATVALEGTNIATVTNGDGEFILKFPSEIGNPRLKTSHLGYRSVITPLNTDEGGEIVIRMTLEGKELHELVVRGDAQALVEEALKKIPENYSQVPGRYEAFYRETVRKGSRYVAISEAVIDVWKSSYNRRDIYSDRVAVLKGRRLLSQKAADTLAIKISGGLQLPVIHDIVKNPESMLSEDEFPLYDFSFEKPASIDGRPQYVVRIRPVGRASYALVRGIFYIDKTSLTITRAEYELDMSDRDLVTRLILRKKPAGLRFRPQEVTVVATYRDDGGVSYLNYVNASMKFKCDWKRRLFSSSYVTETEMVMVDRTDGPVEKIPRKEAVGPREVFSDQVSLYWDPEFWRDYNIIEPTESLEKAAYKLHKQNRR